MNKRKKNKILVLKESTTRVFHHCPTAQNSLFWEMAAGAKPSQRLDFPPDMIFHWMTDTSALSESGGEETAPSVCKVWREFSEAGELGHQFFNHLFMLKRLLMGDEQCQAAAWWLGENWQSQQEHELCCSGRWIEELAVWFIHSGVYHLITVFSGWELEELIDISNQSIPHQDHNYFLWPISPTLLLLRGQDLLCSPTCGLYIHIRRAFFLVKIEI